MQHHPADRCVPMECNKDEIASLKAEAKEWKKKYQDLDRSIIAEGRDPSGTIWEWCEKVQKENKALTLSVGILNRKLMTAMELLRQWSGDDEVMLSVLHKETYEFLKSFKGEPCRTK